MHHCKTKINIFHDMSNRIAEFRKKIYGEMKIPEIL